MRVESQWVDHQWCPQCGAMLWVRAPDLYAKDGTPHYTCGNCEREVAYAESGLHTIPPFVREQVLARTGPARLMGEGS